MKGVQPIPGGYRIRIEYMDPRSGKRVELDRVRHVTRKEARRLLIQWRAEALAGRRRP